MNNPDIKIRRKKRRIVVDITASVCIIEIVIIAGCIHE